jgi:hypothetical protein
VTPSKSDYAPPLGSDSYKNVHTATNDSAYATSNFLKRASINKLACNDHWRKCTTIGEDCITVFEFR